MVNLITFLILILAIIIYYKIKIAIAKRIMLKWFEDKGCKIIKMTYHFPYEVREVKYSPYQQVLHVVEFLDKYGNTHRELFIVGNWFWGLLKEEVWCSWDESF
ncbi:MAG: hypothetical protein PQJ46_14975 [Spirochaetales bacterium]|nr:hypothetical protein [Spirochaetales bacterium]